MLMVAECPSKLHCFVPQLKNPMYRVGQLKRRCIFGEKICLILIFQVFSTTPSSSDPSSIRDQIKIIEPNSNSTGKTSNSSTPLFSPDVLPVLDAAGFRLVPMEPVEIAVHLEESPNNGVGLVIFLKSKDHFSMAKIIYFYFHGFFSTFTPQIWENSSPRDFFLAASLR